ncbi:hypothetical protein PCL_03054 [Purpureocillium lilacinum]|uniref:Uncharacterized protein n=1 Tax=Purpureocillium lilacinum TaxID=33203 RepID=A0A2U3DYI9_PURLI|nr:hypothetical protein Purlil1_493 [Purpureocillium lilacinum]PWI67286.1 hypothetical protein PCL_03054 [Purpureocillium lilacinum]
MHKWLAAPSPAQPSSRAGLAHGSWLMSDPRPRYVTVAKLGSRDDQNAETWRANRAGDAASGQQGARVTCGTVRPFLVRSLLYSPTEYGTYVSTSPRVRTAYEGRRCCGSGRRPGTGGQAHSVLARCRRTNPAPAAVLDERKPLAWHGLAARQPGIHTARVSERARDTREKDTLDSGFDDWSQWAREPSWGPVVPIRKFEGWPWRGAPSFSSVPCCTTFVLVLCTDGRTAAHHSPIEARAPRTYMSAGMI